MGSKFAQLPFHVQEKEIFRKSICQDDQLNIWYLITYVPFTSVYQTQYISIAKLSKWLSCVVSTYLYDALDCMFLSCHVRILEWIHTL